MSEDNTIHKFTSITEICNALNITRPTFYRRVQALGWSKDKREFTDSEYKELQKTLYFNNGKNSKRDKDNTKNTEVTTNIIQDYQQQIARLHNLLDQQQKLSLDLQQKLNARDERLEQLESTQQQYITLKDHSEAQAESIDELVRYNEDLKKKLETEQNKGFWSRLFGKG